MASKLDQLFRENLDQLEIKPSAEAWGQVKDQLGPKKNLTRIWPATIAAAVLILLTATLVVISTNKGERRLLLSSVDHPVEETEIKVLVTKKNTARLTHPNEKSGEMMVKETKQIKKVYEKVDFQEMELIHVAALNHPKLDVNLPPRKLLIHEEVERADEQYIRITYIASSGKATTDTSKEESKLNKVITIARDMSTSDILADIREAKDNLFRRNN